MKQQLNIQETISSIRKDWEEVIKEYKRTGSLRLIPTRFASGLCYYLRADYVEERYNLVVLNDILMVIYDICGPIGWYVHNSGIARYRTFEDNVLSLELRVELLDKISKALDK